MKRTARILIVTSLLAVVTATLSPAASAKAKEVDLLTGKTAAVMAGSDSWVVLNWTSDEDISDFRVVVDDPGDVTVSYPTNLGTWTGLAGGHFLDTDEVDFSALKVSVPADYTNKDASIKVEVSYQFEGKTQSGTFKFKVPVVQFEGGVAVSQTSDSATVAGADWVSVSYAGLAPSSNGFDLTVTDPAGLTIIYPRYDSSTSLYNDATLSAGESDSADFYVDASSADPGVYPVGIQVTYDAGQGLETLAGTVNITVP